MARIYRDDMTGEEFESENDLSQFGVIAHDMLYDDFDISDETVVNRPDAVAEKLHDIVDAWVEGHKEHIESEADYLTECHSCGYRWEYTGEKEKATCPNCNIKTPVGNSPQDHE